MLAQREDRLAQTEQAERECEREEKLVSRPTPRAEEEEPADEEAERHCAGQEGIERHRLIHPRDPIRSPR